MILGCWVSCPLVCKEQRLMLLLQAAGSLLRLDQGSESVSGVVVRCRIASAALFLAVACLFCIGVIWGCLINSHCTLRRLGLLVMMSALLASSSPKSATTSFPSSRLDVYYRSSQPLIPWFSSDTTILPPTFLAKERLSLPSFSSCPFFCSALSS